VPADKVKGWALAGPAPALPIGRLVRSSIGRLTAHSTAGPISEPVSTAADMLPATSRREAAPIGSVATLAPSRSERGCHVTYRAIELLRKYAVWHYHPITNAETPESTSAVDAPDRHAEQLRGLVDAGAQAGRGVGEGHNSSGGVTTASDHTWPQRQQVQVIAGSATCKPPENS